MFLSIRRFSGDIIRSWLIAHCVKELVEITGICGSHILMVSGLRALQSTHGHHSTAHIRWLADQMKIHGFKRDFPCLLVAVRNEMDRLAYS